MRILVTGATGRSVIGDLLDRQHTVRVMIRQPQSLQAAWLRDLGVEIARGDLDDRPSLRAALKDCAGVFAGLEGGRDPALGSGRGRNLINAVAGSEVEYLVFSTTFVPAFEPERLELEAYARSLELPATFIRLHPDDDPTAVGAVVATMFDDPAAFVGRTFEQWRGSPVVT